MLLILNSVQKQRRRYVPHKFYVVMILDEAFMLVGEEEPTLVMKEKQPTYKYSCLNDHLTLYTYTPTVQIQKSMQARDLQVVGWYHSHPVSEPKPSQNDILSQKKYQDAVRMKDVAAEPCIGVIVSKP